jgi:hypothetical protein
MNSRRLQKTPELNQSGLQEYTYLEGTRGPHAKTEPDLGPAQADWPNGEADRAPWPRSGPASGRFLHRLLGLI